MQSRSYLFLLLVLGLAGLSGYLFTIKPFQLGLDVQGGVRFTYQIDQAELTSEQKNNLPELLRKTVETLEDRAAGALAVAEPSIQAKGTDQVTIELPSFRDIQKAREVLSTTGQLRWYHAKNVNTETVTFRPYSIFGRDTDDYGRPSATFTKRGAEGKIIKKGDPEYLAMIKGWGEPIVQGDELARADIAPKPGGGYVPSMEFTPKGAEKMGAWTLANRYKGENLAAVLDDNVLSIAKLAEGEVITSHGQINGEFTEEYVSSLVRMLNSGALPVQLKEIQSQTIDPTVGKQALQMIYSAGAISFAFIALFLVVYYVFPGIVALIALALYTLFTLTVLKLAGATFSLAAIAGFILSVGMAVDANILVFERLKEEMRAGKTLIQAIELGFKRAFPAILDSNVCTLITSFVLAQVGTGPVRGFASTLVIGVLISMFTAVFITRSLLVFLVGSGLGANPKWYGLNRQWFGEGLEERADSEPLHVVNNWKRYFLISALTIVPGVIFLAMGGLKPNVEFRGGYEGTYKVDAGLTTKQVVDTLEGKGIKGANVKFSSVQGAGRYAMITVPEDTQQIKADQNNGGKILAELAGVPYDASSDFQMVGPVVRQETIQGAVKGVIISSILIIVWLSIRFGVALGGFLIGLRFALSAILALVHDVLVVIGLAAIMGYLLNWELSALFISALLTVIGFSTHDTIVIFDRIRENLRRPLPGENVEHLFNRSITQSFARSINTSMTVIVTLGILMAIGSATPDLRLMTAAMLVGIVSGTYSSIFNAAPILYLWDKWIEKTKGEQFTLLGAARHAAAQSSIPVMRADATVAATTAAPAGYGQVKRRASAVQRSKSNLDDEP